MLKPGVVMGYTMSSDYGQFKKIEDLGIPVVINGEYREQHPMGRAEWIKFMGLFFNREKAADSVFSAIEKNYLDAQALLDTVTERNNDLSGIVYVDAWYVPAWASYAAQTVQDARY